MIMVVTTMSCAKITMLMILTCAGHSDDGPVEGLWQGVELGVRLVLLKGVAQPREDEHAHAHGHAQQQQLPAGTC
jgi:hypothetical protein